MATAGSARAPRTHPCSGDSHCDGLHGCSNTGRGRQRTGNAWFFEAKRGDETFIVQTDVKLGDDDAREVVAIQEASRRPKFAATPLLRENRVQFNRQPNAVQSVAKNSPSNTESAETAKAMNVDKLAEVGAKRPQAEQPSSSSKQAPPETKKAKVEPW